MKSMTGFGRGEAVSPDGTTLCVEINSVNRKQLEIHVSLPPESGDLDRRARGILGERFRRGAVSLKVTVTPGLNGNPAVRVNRGLLQEMASVCDDLCARFRTTAKFDPATLFLVPGVLDGQETAAAEARWVASVFEQTVRKAMDDALRMREKEGAVLHEDLCARLEELRRKLAAVRELAPDVNERIRRRLLEKLKSENLISDPDDGSLLRELLFYADRSDVTEEIVRMESHFSQFVSFLDRHDEPVGRSLDFLVQEMFREITTLGNKAGSSEISKLVVEFKSELEKIREQIQNVE